MAAKITASSSWLSDRSSTVATSATHISARRNTCFSSGSYAAAGPGASGLILVLPPGVKRIVVRPRCSASGAYSPLGSTMAIQRPFGP
jgi:hypothetical protein